MSRDLFSRPVPAGEPATPAPSALAGPPVDPRAGHPLRCHCGDWAPFGFGVDVRRGQIGVWRCKRDALAEGFRL